MFIVLLFCQVKKKLKKMYKECKTNHASHFDH